MMDGERGPSAVAAIVIFGAGLVVGYAGSDVFGPLSGDSGLRTSSSAVRVAASPQAICADGKREIPLNTEEAQRHEAGSGKVLGRPSAVKYEPVPGTEASIAELHETMPDPGPDVQLGGRDRTHLVSSDDPDVAASINAQREEAYHHQSDLIAELESGRNPPTWEPDEGDLQNQYLYDGLPEIGELEEMDTLQDNRQELALDESEHPIPPEASPLPPLTE